MGSRVVHVLDEPLLIGAKVIGDGIAGLRGSPTITPPG
jgi:hypothetical protein